MAMNIIELKGIAGDTFGWDSGDVKDNSIDTIRVRNVSLNLTNGRGTQVDVNFNRKDSHLADENGNLSGAQLGLAKGINVGISADVSVTKVCTIRHGCGE